MTRLERIYHPYWEWEEVQLNMWGKPKNRDAQLQEAIELTGNHQIYGSWMLKAINICRFSCEHNLTDTSQNRRAWIGHLACALAIGCPEDITRRAWSFLSEQQQKDANAQADRAIKIWVNQFKRSKSHAKNFTGY